MVINWDGIITYFIYSELFDETYTAHIQKTIEDSIAGEKIHGTNEDCRYS